MAERLPPPQTLSLDFCPFDALGLSSNCNENDVKEAWRRYGKGRSPEDILGFQKAQKSHEILLSDYNRYTFQMAKETGSSLVDAWKHVNRRGGAVYFFEHFNPNPQRKKRTQPVSASPFDDDGDIQPVVGEISPIVHKEDVKKPKISTETGNTGHPTILSRLLELNNSRNVSNMASSATQKMEPTNATETAGKSLAKIVSELKEAKAELDIVTSQRDTARKERDCLQLQNEDLSLQNKNLLLQLKNLECRLENKKREEGCKRDYAAATEIGDFDVKDLGGTNTELEKKEADMIDVEQPKTRTMKRQSFVPDVTVEPKEINPKNLKTKKIKLPCHLCSREYSRKDTLKNHLRHAHGISQKKGKPTLSD